jgi:DNA-binding NtrC family response regulator
MGKRVPGVSPEAMARLAAYGWPGNVRELQNEIQRMLVRGRKGAGWGCAFAPYPCLPRPRRSPRRRPLLADLAGPGGDLKERVSAMEARIIRETPDPPPLEQEQHRARTGPAAWGCAPSWSAMGWKMSIPLEAVRRVPAQRGEAGR